MKQVLTHSQTQMLRRFLLMVATDLASMANSPKLPDQWDQLGCMSFSNRAMEAIYDAMAREGYVPARTNKTVLNIYLDTRKQAE